MFIGIDIGGTNIKGVLTNRKGDIISFKKISTANNLAKIEYSICSLIKTLSSQKSGSKSIVKAAGIGSAGSIDTRKGIIITSPNIKSLNNYPLARKINKLTGLKVFLENDATAAIIGEWWKGNGRNFSNWIMLTLGTGIGGGVIINDQLFTGQSGSAMEAGHMTIDYKGKKCLCGNRGCLETYASATALVKLTRSKLKNHPSSTINKRIINDKLTSKIVFEEAVKGDLFAKDIFNEISFFIGIGISNLVNIFNPEAIILGGGLSKAHRLLLPNIKKVVAERALEGLKENVKFLTSMDFDKIAALGAAKITIDACK
jgi:glucokinase